MVTYYLFQIGNFLSKFIPRNIVLFLSNSIGLLFYLLAFKKRKIINSNLKLIVANRKISDVSLKIFQNYAKYFIDLIYVPKLSSKKISGLININGEQNLINALNKGKGVIIVTAHFGNWDIGGIKIAQKYPINAVAEFLKPKKVFDFYTNLRSEKGVKIIPLGDSLKTILEKLKNNEIVALLSDRVINGKGMEITFFSKKVIMPIGVITIALRSQAIILPGFVIRNKNNSYTVLIKEPIEIIFGKDLKETIKINTQKLTNIIEQMIIQYPEQWYMLQPLKYSKTTSN